MQWNKKSSRRIEFTFTFHMNGQNEWMPNVGFQFVQFSHHQHWIRFLIAYFVLTLFTTRFIMQMLIILQYTFSFLWIVMRIVMLSMNKWKIFQIWSFCVSMNNNLLWKFVKMQLSQSARWCLSFFSHYKYMPHITCANTGCHLNRPSTLTRPRLIRIWTWTANILSEIWIFEIYIWIWRSVVRNNQKFYLYIINT